MAVVRPSIQEGTLLRSVVGGRWETGPVLLDELVTTADAVASTRSRLAKVDALADAARAGSSPTRSRRRSGSSSASRGRGGSASAGAGVAAAMGEPADDADAHGRRRSTPLLDRLAAASGAGSVAARGRELRELTARATEREQGFLGARARSASMRTGRARGRAHRRDRAGRRPARPTSCGGRRCSSGDLGETARARAHRHRGRRSTRSGSSSARRCCRCSPPPPRARPRRSRPSGEASVEYKLDGARIQVHRVGDDVRVFTRNLADITAPAARGRRGRATDAGARRDPRRRDALARRRRRAAAVPGHDVALRRRGRARDRCCIRGSSTCCTSTGAT